MSTPAPGRLTISVEGDDDIPRLVLEGELDLASASAVEERLASLEQRGPKRIVIDLNRLAFIDSTGLRTLIQADARAREHGRELWLRRGDDSIQRVFELTGAMDVLTFEDPQEQSSGA